MKILIGADLCPREATEKAFIEGNGELLFGKAMNLINSADRFIVNLECALTECDSEIRKFGPNLRAHPLVAEGLKKIGVTDALLSNNHVFDYGEKGLTDTMECLDRVKIGYTGVGMNDTESRLPYFIDTENGKRIAIVNVCEHEYCYALEDKMGANPFDPFLTMHDIRAAKSLADFVFVFYHGGKEYSRYPSERLYNACHEMVECGADLVITQHSHCIGCYEQYLGSHILYGQGNLNFLMQSKYEGWYTSLLVELDVDKGIDISFYPLKVVENGVDLASGQEAREIMKGFSDRSEQLKDGSWKEGFRSFCNEVSPSYINALKNAFRDDSSERERQLFCHYLDCEAHTDVWRILYETWQKTDRR